MFARALNTLNQFSKVTALFLADTESQFLQFIFSAFYFPSFVSRIRTRTFTACQKWPVDREASITMILPARMTELHFRTFQKWSNERIHSFLTATQIRLKRFRCSRLSGRFTHLVVGLGLCNSRPLVTRGQYHRLVARPHTPAKFAHSANERPSLSHVTERSAGLVKRAPRAVCVAIGS